MYPLPIVEYSFHSLPTNDWDMFFPWPIFNQPAAASGKRPSCDVQISVMDFTKDIASRLVDMPIKAGEFHLHRASPLSPWFLNRLKQFEYRFLGYCKAFGLSSLQPITAPHLGTIARGEDAKGQASRCLWRSSTVSWMSLLITLEWDWILGKTQIGATTRTTRRTTATRTRIWQAVDVPGAFVGPLCTPPKARVHSPEEAVLHKWPPWHRWNHGVIPGGLHQISTYTHQDVS